MPVTSRPVTEAFRAPLSLRFEMSRIDVIVSVALATYEFGPLRVTL
jgi:hypothetical protein